MTIQPNNQAPKFQDPAETTDRAEETRKPDAVKDNKPVAKDGRRGPTDSDTTAAATAASKKSPDNPAVRSSEDRTADAKRSSEESTAHAVKKSPEDKATTDAKKSPENQAPVAARTRLFEDQDVTRFREQWRELQAGFVDEPRGAVREADTLVSQMMDTLTAQLTEQKRALQGDSDAQDTEQLRVALQRYRSLFDQMLQV